MFTFHFNEFKFNLIIHKNKIHYFILVSFLLMRLETIVNEHPVTIYPGPLPQKRVPPRTLPGSIERHREVCRKNPSSDLSSSSSTSTSTSSSSQESDKSPIKELKSPLKSNNDVRIVEKGDLKQGEAENGAQRKQLNADNDNDNEFIKRPMSPMKNATPLEIKISIQTMDNLMNNRNLMKMEQKMNMKNLNSRNSQLSINEDDDEDKFSDDSLEDTSLPPPAPPPIVVPPPPSLSAPVTPSKRHSIAWEVNLDDLCASGNGFGAKV